MGKTMIEKIIRRAAGREVKVGERVWCDIDLSTARDFGGANCVLQFEEVTDKKGKVWNPDKVAFTFDLQAPSHSEKVSNNQKIIREFAKKQGIKKVFDVDWGIGQHVLLENGLVKPGDDPGTDSHMNLLGGVGAFRHRRGNTDIVASWLREQPSPASRDDEDHRHGQVQKGVCMRDLLTHMGDLGADGCSSWPPSSTGETIENSSLAERITLCSMVTERAARWGSSCPTARSWTGWSAGPATRSKKGSRPSRRCRRCLRQGTGVQRDDLEPMTSRPDAPDNVKKVREVAGGARGPGPHRSCSNGRFEDITAAFEVLKAGGFKVALLACAP